eukprot:COSAG01_NODE_9038_length_2573_cov_18.817300_2_plen_57_part_00
MLVPAGDNVCVVVAIGAAVDCNYSYLQQQQDKYRGLVPNHPDNGTDITKFFAINSF